MLRARLPDPVVFCAEAGSEVRVVDLPARAADTAFRGPVPGNGKTDAKDAFIIVDAARTLSDTLLPIGKACDLVEGLRMLSEFDADLAVDENRLTPAVDAVVGESMGVRTGVTMLVEITDIGRSATQGRSRFTPGSHLAHIALERPSKVSIDNTAATPDSNAPSIFSVRCSQGSGLPCQLRPKTS
ncbi:transposase [Rhodococcus sp. IEGM 1241]|nr:transposase [Rhodococcus sp. IEGM 1241]MDJ0106536.1 transposase [Rhodococcus erythropolis]MDV8011664.1 transposase [Rhodococcus sp. IEGM 1241]